MSYNVLLLRQHEVEKKAMFGIHVWRKIAPGGVN